MSDSHFTSNSLSRSVYNSMRRLNLRSCCFLSTAHFLNSLTPAWLFGVLCYDPVGCISLYASCFAQASHLILLSSTTVNKNRIQRHRKIFQARYNLLQPKEWNRGMVSLQEAFLPWINLELPCLLSNLVSNLARQVWRWSYSSFAFQKNICAWHSWQLPWSLSARA